MSNNKHGGVHVLPLGPPHMSSCTLFGVPRMANLMPKTGRFLASTGFVIKRQSVPGSLKLLGTGQPRQIFSTAPPVDMSQNHGDRCFTSRVHIQDTLFISIFYLEGCPRLSTEDMTHNVTASKSVVCIRISIGSR